jgi:hypothetical protein
MLDSAALSFIRDLFLENLFHTFNLGAGNLDDMVHISVTLVMGLDILFTLAAPIVREINNLEAQGATEPIVIVVGNHHNTFFPPSVKDGGAFKSSLSRRMDRMDSDESDAARLSATGRKRLRSDASSSTAGDSMPSLGKKLQTLTITNSDSAGESMSGSGERLRPLTITNSDSGAGILPRPLHLVPDYMFYDLGPHNLPAVDHPVTLEASLPHTNKVFDATAPTLGSGKVVAKQSSDIHEFTHLKRLGQLRFVGEDEDDRFKRYGIIDHVPGKPFLELQHYQNAKDKDAVAKNAREQIGEARLQIAQKYEILHNNPVHHALFEEPSKDSKGLGLPRLVGWSHGVYLTCDTASGKFSTEDENHIRQLHHYVPHSGWRGLP